MLNGKGVGVSHAVTVMQHLTYDHLCGRRINPAKFGFITVAKGSYGSGHRHTVYPDTLQKWRYKLRPD